MWDGAGMEPGLVATLMITAVAVWPKPAAGPLKGRMAQRALVQMASIIVVFLQAAHLFTLFAGRPVPGQPAGYA
jgi:hypothetical protein